MPPVKKKTTVASEIGGFPKIGGSFPKNLPKWSHGTILLATSGRNVWHNQASI